MSKQQKAVLVKEIGKPVVLGERDVPIPAHDEVLVKVTATMREHNLIYLDPEELQHLTVVYSTFPRCLWS